MVRGHGVGLLCGPVTGPANVEDIKKVLAYAHWQVEGPLK
jgi:hypothetical protein